MAKDIKAFIREEEALLAASEKRLKKLQTIEKELIQLTSSRTLGVVVAKRGSKEDAGKKVSRGAPRGKRTGPTLAETIKELVARQSGNLASGDIVRLVITERAGTKPPSVYTTLNKLKKDGSLSQENGIWFGNS